MITCISCDDMNSIHQDYLDEGEKVYLGKVNEPESFPGRNRVKLIWYQNADPDITQTVISWNAGKDSIVKTFDRTTGGIQKDSIIIDVEEGTYSFNLFNANQSDDKSLISTVQEVSYGDNYEKYLVNRMVESASFQEGEFVVQLSATVLSNMIGSDIFWQQNGMEEKLFVTKSKNKVTLENFSGLSFAYQTLYMPKSTAIDTFYAAKAIYAMNISADKVTPLKEGNTLNITFPVINDPYYTGIEITWVQDGVEHIYTLDKDNTIAAIDNFDASRINYRTMFDYDATTYYSEYTELQVLNPVNLNRSGWTVTASHNLPTDPANNSTDNIKDGDNDTFLSLIKPGKSYAGVTVSAGETVYFVIDMGTSPTFDYFILRHRQGNEAATSPNLRVHKASFYGSNTGGNDYVLITGVDIDVDAQENRYDIPRSTYRYLKMTYDQWTDTSSAMQIAEFYLGLWQ
ncbi:MAG: DUF4998 domain-containing protein [Bacteroidales bacterium]|jgi:hypothetical protein|nr:DUF4998 domain-containing protein [Bacteroidales bacterium]